MTGECFAELAARHLQRQQTLLALCRHTLAAPGFDSPESDDWLKKRWNLLSQFAMLREPTAGPLEGTTIELLQAMQQSELRIMDSIARLEAQLLARGQERFHTVARLLQVATQQRVAHQCYRRAGRPSREQS